MHCIHKTKFIWLTLLSVLLLFSLMTAATAEEGTAIGNFPNGTGGSSETDADSSQAAEEKTISLSDGSRYAPASGLFYRDVEGGSFGVSVPDGAIVTGVVYATASSSVKLTLYKNGIELTEADLSCISEKGKYVLSASVNDTSKAVRVAFTIIASPTGAVKEYTMPSDFYVVSATLNGEATGYSQAYVDLSRDGDYVIDYRSPKADKDMQLAVTIDHTPPTVTLTGITDGKANCPVTVSDVEEDAALYLTKNGNQVAYTGTISETGSYVLTVKDRAGNETAYEFVVITYANGSVKLLLATVALLVLALAGYLIYYRKYIRVS